MLAKVVRCVCVVSFLLVMTGATLGDPGGNQNNGPEELQAGDGQAKTCDTKLSDFAWLEGRWSGQLPFGAFELEYSGLSGGMMTSMFRLMPEGTAVMLELASLRDTPNGIELRFRHFGADLSAWEEKGSPIVMRCVAASADSWTFENAAHDRPKRSIVTRLSPDEYAFRTQIGSGDAVQFMQGTARRVGVLRSESSASHRRVTKEVVVDGTPAQVWAAWTDPKEMSKFFAAESSVIELRVGGKYELHMVPNGPAGSRGCEGCSVLSYLPLRMLSFTWTAPPSIPGLRDKGIMTHVVVSMEEVEAGKTLVRISQMGFGAGEDWDKCYSYFDAAWPKVLEWLGDKIGSIQAAQDAETLDTRLTFDVEVDGGIDDVWKAFTTKSGVESWMVPLAEVDFGLHGALRTNYDAKGTIGDPGTITHRIMSYEPRRMLALQAAECPAGFPHEEATKNTWAVVQFDSLSASRTRVRLASAGLKSGPDAEAMIKFFEEGNAWTLKQLQKRFASKEEARASTSGK